MARQTSFIKLEGTIGDVTFYKGANGSFARQKGGVSKNKIMNDPAFQRTRENLAEFARAAAASQLLKGAFREITLRAKDLRTHNRLYAMAMKIIKSDLVNGRGLRQFSQGDMSLMLGFQFNINAGWSTTVYARFDLQNDASELTANFHDFVPSIKVSKPTGATHFRFFFSAAAINADENTSESTYVASPVVEITNEVVSGFSFSIPKLSTPDTTKVYAMGIEYLQEVNENLYDLNNKIHNSSRIMLVE
ncbi:hypothetical protein [Belliella pelovolcani]|uniref:Uncharacterized protein n=1 Tax=Belliella pelovolcani TaxID=529505 RepID=A0A1N7Q3S8_9BACT|nr:hypothetical protein [Belliella pelovolcani]SIT17503.1 hypothetical protein SAMN05421761_1284 [Belliella pelovolcani]